MRGRILLLLFYSLAVFPWLFATGSRTSDLSASFDPLTVSPDGFVTKQAALVLASPALAQSLVLRPVSGGAPLELTPRPGYQVGKALLENRGPKAVSIVHVGMREGSDHNPRLPEGVSATLPDGRARAEILPGASLPIDVQWRLGRERRARELYAHLQVETAEGQKLALGVHAELGDIAPVLGKSPLSWLVFLPLLGIGALGAARLGRLRRTRNLRMVPIAVGLVQLALAVFFAVRFDVTFGRFDGNDGLQLIERTLLLPSSGVEYSLGVDGTTIVLVLLVPLLVIIAALCSYSIDRWHEAYFALLLFADVGLLGAACAVDLALWLGFLVVALLALALLVAYWGGPDAAATARNAALWAGAAVLLLAFGIHHLSAQAGPSLLVDGSLAPRTLSLAELARVDLLARADRIFGINPLKLLWTVLFVGLCVLAGAPPFHGWLSRSSAGPPAAVAILFVALRSVAFVALLRVLYVALPAGTLWASLTLAALGAFGAIFAALAACQAPDVSHLAARFCSMQAGLVLLALSSLTGIGVQGLLLLAVSQGLFGALLFGVASTLRDRVGTDSLHTLGGLGRELPPLALLAGIGLCGACAMPGTSGFGATLTALAGAFPAQRMLVLAAAFALVVATVAALRAHTRLFAGEVPESWRAHPRLEPHGGRFPALAERELGALVPLALLVLALGLWPRPLLRLTGTAALDHAAFVNPPGPTEIVRAPVSPREQLALAGR